MDSDGDDIPFEDSDDELGDEQEYQVLDTSTLESEMKETISDVQDVLEVTPGVARILLHKFKWNKDQLMEKFYENPDTEAFLVESQVIPKPKEKPTPLQEVVTSSPPPPSEDEEEECEICCDFTQLSGLACGHRACTMCWQFYIADKIKEGISEIQCMASDCKLLMADEKITEYITEESAIEKYHQLAIKSYVETNNLLSWCPGANCDKAIKVKYNEPRLVACSCGTRFCFFCSSDVHRPASCRLIKLWKKKLEEVKLKTTKGEGYGADSETFGWLMSNTKDCPKCLVSIEKNGGCNYMQCRNAACRYQFCWVCMNAWSVHANGWYKCNAYDADAEKTREKSRADLHRFLFYFTRYDAHEKSLGLEQKLRGKLRLKMNAMEQNCRWIEVQYLQKAVDTLSECRRIMMFSYVFAYYLKRDNNALIFEGNQKDLEMATEQLSMYLEREMEGVDYDTLRQNVLDKCRYVDHRRQALLDHCTEGDDHGFWSFTD